MKTFLSLKKWLTVPETARRLAIIFGEEVSEADVLRLALDGHLRLSINFVNSTKALRGKVISIEDAKYEYELLPSGFADLFPSVAEFKTKPIRVLQGWPLDGNRLLEMEKNVTDLCGVYDLAMLGIEISYLEHEYQMLTNGPPVIRQGIVGPLEVAPQI